VWQQDRWGTGGARGLLTATSFDAGRTWQKSAAPFTRCSGGNAANGGDFWRASDPWVSIGPDGTAFQVAIAFGGGAQQSPAPSAVLVSRSRDGGVTWDGPAVLIEDGAAFFNDKESITADPTDARFAYAIWDRLDATQQGSTWLARTTNGGDTWEAPRLIYDPGPGRSTLGNQVVVLPDGTLVAFFTELTVANGETVSAVFGVVRSLDRGATWSARTIVTDVRAVGASDSATGLKLRDGAGLAQIAVTPTGRLVIALQDARLSGGVRDAVVIFVSDDRGTTWSDAIRVSPDFGVAAIVPSLAIARDGTIGITYFDFRNDTADGATLVTDVWLARSVDAVHWSETHVDGPFDFRAAPSANGLFLGDYQGLAAIGNAFVPFYARTNRDDAANRTDVVAAFVP
jgi:hypothetical protein